MANDIFDNDEESYDISLDIIINLINGSSLLLGKLSADTTYRSYYTVLTDISNLNSTGTGVQSITSNGITCAINSINRLPIDTNKKIETRGGNLVQAYEYEVNFTITVKKSSFVTPKSYDENVTFFVKGNSTFTTLETTVLNIKFTVYPNTSSGITNYTVNEIYLKNKLLSQDIPIGTIIMYYGAVSNIPDGWAICNGNNGTPDLTDRIIVGTKTANYSSAGNQSFTEPITLQQKHLPKHSHAFTVKPNSPSVGFVVSAKSSPEYKVIDQGDYKNLYYCVTADGTKYYGTTTSLTSKSMEMEYDYTQMPLPTYKYQTLLFIMKIK